MLISTIHGDIDDSLLEMKSGNEEDNDKYTSWVEYWKDNELVHRSVDLRLKRGLDFSLDAANFR